MGWMDGTDWRKGAMGFVYFLMGWAWDRGDMGGTWEELD